MIKTKTKTIFILLLCTMLLIIGLFVFMLREISDKIDLVTVHYAESMQRKNISFGNALKKEKSQLLAQEEIIFSKFLNENELVGFITKLENLASQNSLKIEIEKVEKGTIETIEESYKLQPISFSLSLTGSVEKIELFVKQITGQKEKISVKEFKLYKIMTEGGGYNARIILNANSISL